MRSADAPGNLETGPYKHSFGSFALDFRERCGVAVCSADDPGTSKKRSVPTILLAPSHVQI